MDSVRKTALIAGVFYLVISASYIPAVFLLGPVLSDASYIISPGDDTGVVWGCLLDLINAFACVGTAVALFPVVRRQNDSLALGFVTARTLEAAVIAIGVVSLLAVVTLRQSGAANAEPGTLVSAGQALVAVRDWTFLLGLGTIPAFNALLLGYLLFRSRLVPRVIPILGLIGAPLLLVSAITTMFGINSQGFRPVRGCDPAHLPLGAVPGAVPDVQRLQTFAHSCRSCRAATPPGR
ncbi:DUF4386 domain-containing protein [Pseudarthrobacter sp. NamE5]|uniref:DUF4386 domain-containing protein n=1 Tax=Pseudarthrobacter sp. NamE5 TaxID=2576839 RepID=UPI00197ACF9C|nr:DUF4386 domain-containing protein [Pseudarthrobacter sp. NamE5]